MITRALAGTLIPRIEPVPQCNPPDMAGFIKPNMTDKESGVKSRRSYENHPSWNLSAKLSDLPSE